MKRIKNKVDKLADIRAQINELAAVEKKLEAELKAMGVGKHIGTEHYANVFEQTADTVNWKAVAAKLNPSPQLVAAHTKRATKVVLKLTAYPAGGNEAVA